MQETTRETTCCIVGGGPAGVMLGLLLARAGVDVTVLEKHADFFRDFRGDTIHSSTLDLIDGLGLRAMFLRIPQTSITTLDIVVGGTRLTLVDFRTLRGPNRRIALMPQWDFLDLLAQEARTLPNFKLLMETTATGLLHDAPGAAVTGVLAQGPGGPLRINATLTVAADGRDSLARRAAGLQPEGLGVPIDVLWFRLPTPPSPPPDTLGYLRNGTLLITIPRTDYYQMGMLIPKGGFEAIRAQGLAAFRRQVRTSAPFLSQAVESLHDWEDVKLLSVQLDRLRQWSAPGLLCIGDAAHAMSPVFGVGVNYAVQDAVAAARLLAPPLLAGRAVDQAMRQFQGRREWPVRLMQPLQQQVHKAISGAASAKHGEMAPWQARLATLGSKAARPVVARLVGRGFLPERLPGPAAAKSSPVS
ncbi:FAD-dependent oxidoreductase [Arthrobacter sp. SDTb3-6]|uniref:FAD-dependent oxidoreductase n=1 Tax=Arthrobacter sp. SDTb3-6 TaxID=2713571 RepID=UPI00159DD140|nr:FAD-dependent oxidoreductase [Arthrobacter sp. SDTb3-6]NVN00002.1 FAD-dependent oxidoreductase [Arthrobacter sp. SDTb3-6]